MTLHRFEPVRVPLVNPTDEVRYALVDAEDEALVSGYRWRLAKNYVQTNVADLTVRMHRLILGLRPGDGLEGEHRNRLGWDNRRANLLVLTHALNGQNQPSVGRSPFRGVSWNQSTRKWQARAKLAGKSYFIGEFTDEAEAGRAAANWRREHMPYAMEDSHAS